MDETIQEPNRPQGFIRKYFGRIVVGLILMAMVYSAINVNVADQNQRWLTSRIQIEEPAFNAIDFSTIEEPIREFIEIAKARKAIGQPASNFARLFELTFKSEAFSFQNKSILRHEFVLPVTEEGKNRLSQYEVPCWPMMLIELDAKTKTISRVRIYSQCL